MRVLAIAVVAILAAGCASQSAVQNNTNHFQYGGQAAGKTDTETYTWKNTMGKATVQWGGQAAEGTLKITIQDSAGKQVYTGSISGGSQSGTQTTSSAGATGDWKITLTFSEFTGQMGLQVDAKAAVPGF